CVFCFQAEDGIRDRNVTGVQTCALPISIPLGAIQPTSDFSPVVNPVPIVDIKIDKGRTTNIINNTYPIICGLKMCRIVSKFNDEGSIINIAEIKNSDTFSLKCLKSFNELIPALARVIPIAVTDKSSVPCTCSSGNVKLKITTTNTAGDFTNSEICPVSNIKPSTRPDNHTTSTPNAEPNK